MKVLEKMNLPKNERKLIFRASFLPIWPGPGFGWDLVIILALFWGFDQIWSFLAGAWEGQALGLSRTGHEVFYYRVGCCDSALRALARFLRF